MIESLTDGMDERIDICGIWKEFTLVIGHIWWRRLVSGVGEIPSWVQFKRNEIELKAFHVKGEKST